MMALRSKTVQKPLCWAHSEFLTLRKSTAGAIAGWQNLQELTAFETPPERCPERKQTRQVSLEAEPNRVGRD